MLRKESNKNKRKKNVTMPGRLNLASPPPHLLPTPRQFSEEKVGRRITTELKTLITDLVDDKTRKARMRIKKERER